MDANRKVFNSLNKSDINEEADFAGADLSPDQLYSSVLAISCRDGPGARPRNPFNPHNKPSLVRSGLTPSFRPDGPPPRQASAPLSQKDPSPTLQNPSRPSATAKTAHPPPAAGGREAQGRAASQPPQLPAAAVMREIQGKVSAAAAAAAAVPPPKTTTTPFPRTTVQKLTADDGKGAPLFPRTTVQKLSADDGEKEPARSDAQAAAIAQFLANEDEQGMALSYTHTHAMMIINLYLFSRIYT